MAIKYIDTNNLFYFECKTIRDLQIIERDILRLGFYWDGLKKFELLNEDRLMDLRFTNRPILIVKSNPGDNSLMVATDTQSVRLAIQRANVKKLDDKEILIFSHVDKKDVEDFYKSINVGTQKLRTKIFDSSSSPIDDALQRSFKTTRSIKPTSKEMIDVIDILEIAKKEATTIQSKISKDKIVGKSGFININFNITKSKTNGKVFRSDF